METSLVPNSMTSQLGGLGLPHSGDKRQIVIHSLIIESRVGARDTELKAKFLPPQTACTPSTASRGT